MQRKISVFGFEGMNNIFIRPSGSVGQSAALSRRRSSVRVRSGSFIWNLSSAGRASALQAEGHRFEPYRPHIPKDMLKRCADVAQLAEQLICNQQVIGSSPIIGFVKSLTCHVFHMGGFPSGQRGQTVNLLAMPSKVRILLRPLYWVQPYQVKWLHIFCK